ncbi:MAG: hypothetical protein IPM18_12085 [Phycisphaerales bacterium]|nr:hypothetical protein [Phycisphaerales bacterium]
MTNIIAPTKRRASAAPATMAPVAIDPLEALRAHAAHERECARIDAELERAAARDAWHAVVAFLTGKTADSAAAADAIAHLSLDDAALASAADALRERERLAKIAGEVDALEHARAAAAAAVVNFNRTAALEMARLKKESVVASARKQTAVAARDELDKWPARHPQLAAALADQPTN